jgi:AraC-like DNA-binding protein
MPIFMDRHDVSDSLTAEIVAKMHQEDLKIQDQFNCKNFTYWFDGKRKMAFCLIEAPDRESVTELHTKAHGGGPNAIIEVSSEIVELFLGRIADPANLTGEKLNVINDSPFRTIMVISLDLQSYEGSKSNGQNTIELFRRNVIETVAETDGRIVRQPQNGYLVSFDSVTKAVDAAMNLASILQQGVFRSADKSAIKIGLTAGIPVTDKPKIFEETIETAMRFCRIVKGRIIISSTVKELYESESAKRLTTNKHMRYMSKSDETFLNSLVSFIEKNWTDSNFKVGDLARLTTYSKSRLYRKLKTLAGESPNEIVNRYRLEEACNILRNSEKTVAEVAFQTGFSSPSYFTKCFRKKYTYLPSDLINRASKD